jgi:hypothetical protein
LYDSLSDVRGIQQDSVLEQERRWANGVDLMLATSPALLRRHGASYRNTYLVNNGISSGAFRAASEKGKTEAHTIRDIASPRLGYAGVISERLDWELILKLSTQRPDWSFVFAGRVTHPRYARLMYSQSNIYYLGSFDQASVPSIIAGFDIGFLPYLDNEFFHCSNPLKIYEYCAAGLRSVASPIEILNEFPHGIVTVCKNNPSDWIHAIEGYLQDKRPASETRCREFARQHLWEDITSELLEHIEKLLTKPLSRKDALSVEVQA